MDLQSFLFNNLLHIVLMGIITFLLSEPVRLYYGYFIHVARNARRLSEHMKHLEGRMKDLLHGGNGAQLWLSEMVSLKKEAGSFEGDYEKWKRRGFFCRIILRYGIAMKAGDLLERAELLSKVNVDADRLPLLPPVQERDISDFVLGLGPYLQEALGYIQWESRPPPPPVVLECNASEPIHGLESRARHRGPRVIGIFGVGGVGKTTLLKEINNFFALRPAGNVFDHVVWATVHKEINLEQIQEDVARGLGLSLHRAQSLQQRAEVLFNYMKDKSFLLLLDDLWKHLDFEELGIPNPHEGGSQLQRRVVFTTRFQNVCDSMQAMDAKKERIKVAFLSEALAWQLFRRMLGDKFNDSDKKICNLAMGVAKECRGLPLALKVIGTAMSSRKGLDDWEDALESLKKSQPVSGTEEAMFTLLKYSYDNLNDDKLRKCFLCCALWPENFPIKKDYLIRCWMGLRLLDRPWVDERYRDGMKYIQILKDACLLEAGHYKDHYVEMHDVIRDLALQIASDKHKWIVRAGVNLKEAPVDVDQWAAVECISLMYSSFETLSLFERDQGFVEGALPKLSTFILTANHEAKRMPNCFFPCMPNLTYLDLSSICLKELPPEICDLTGLECLNLSSSHIRSLPQEFGRLEKLRYLFLSNTMKLLEVRPEAMPRALEVLDLNGSSIKWEVEGNTIFRSLKKLQVIEGIMVRRTSELQLLLELSHVQIWGIEMQFMFGLASLEIKQSFLGRHLRNHLKWLCITACELTELKVDFGEEGGPGMARSLQRLEFLNLCLLQKLKKIIWRGVEPMDVLPRLQRLCILSCGKLKNISWVLQLPCLEFLDVEYCRGMTTLIDENEIGEGAADLAFPRLKRLQLTEVPQLEGIFCGELAFPSLEVIYVADCPKLRRLPFCSPITNSRLRKIKGRKEWWDGLQWEDECTRTFLHTHFIEIP